MLVFPKLEMTEFVLTKIKAYSAMADDGSHGIALEKSFSCYFEENSKVIRNDKGENITSEHLVIIYNDFPELNNEHKGEVVINDKQYKISNVARFFNFNNTVHHLEIVVI